MEKKFTSIIIAGVVIATVAVLIYFVSQEIQKSHDEGFEWLTSGPFSVQNYQHRLGENIFIVAYGITPDEKGTIRIYTPKNIEYISYLFDGSIKSHECRGRIINTHSFTQNEVEQLCSVLGSKFQLQAWPRQQSDGVQIYISAKSADRLKEILTPYVLPVMRYKLP